MGDLFHYKESSIILLSAGTNVENRKIGDVKEITFSGKEKKELQVLEV